MKSLKRHSEWDETQRIFTTPISTTQAVSLLWFVAASDVEFNPGNRPR